MDITVRAYAPADVVQMNEIWNEVVEDGVAFPQEDYLDAQTGAAFYAEQTYTAVAAGADGQIYGLYILHPNNIGRCGHIANASYAVRGTARGLHIGEKLVSDCLRLWRPAIQRRRGDEHPRPPPLRAPRLHPARHDPQRLPHEGRAL
mgnify:CR=1 FL=1